MQTIRLTAQGRLQGTALYMSPEQITGSKDLDHRTDILQRSVPFCMRSLTLELMVSGQNAASSTEENSG